MSETASAERPKTSGITNPPTPKDAIRYIRTVAYQMVVDEMKHIRLLRPSEDGNSFTFGAGSPIEITVTKDENGIAWSEDEWVRIDAGPQSKENPFAHIMSRIRQTAENRLKERYHDWLGRTRHEHWHATDRDIITATLGQAARGVTAAVTCGYSHTQHTMMQQAFNRFVGQELISETIRICGFRTLLSDIRRIHEHRRQIDRTRATRPNAVMWWHMLVNPPDRDYDRILEHVDNILDGPEYAGLLEKLPPKAMRESEIQANAMLNILDLCRDAGGRAPSYSVARVIIRNHFADLHREIAVQAIVKSDEMRRTWQSGQRRLAKQLDAIRSLPNSDNLGHRDDSFARQKRFLLENFIGEDGQLDWEGAYEAALEVRAHQERREPLMPMDPLDGESGVGQTLEIRPNRGTGTQKRMRAVAADIVMGQGQRAAADAIANSLEIRSIPGVEFQVSARQADGQAQSVIHLICRDGRVVNESLHPDHEPLPIWRDDTWASPGLAQWYQAEATLRILLRHWPQEKQKKALYRPDVEDVLRWMPELRKLAGVEEPQVDDERISREMKTWLRQAIDPDTIARAGALTGRDRHDVRLIDAARAMQAEPFLDELKATNPLATIWSLQAIRPADEPVRHPGQLVSATRNHLAESGFDLRLWKRANNLGSETIAAIMKQSEEPAMLAMMLTAAVNAGVAPEPRDWKRINQVLEESGRTEDEITRINLQRVVTLYIKEHPERPEADHRRPRNARVAWRIGRLEDVRDYALHLSRQGTLCQAKTWTGLCKAAEEWHRQMRISGYARELQRAINQRDGNYRRWESAISEASQTSALDNALAAVAITDELGLLQESHQMRHCVVTYGDSCATGRSRIFAISRNGEKVATTQLARVENGWHAVQTRGLHNHGTDDEIHAFANRVAEQYTEAWTKTNQTRHDGHELVPAPADLFENEMARPQEQHQGDLPF